MKFSIKEMPYIFAYRTGLFPFLEQSQMSKKSSELPSALRLGFLFLNSPKYLDPSYRTDLGIWDCFQKRKTPSHTQRNTVANEPLS